MKQLWLELWWRSTGRDHCLRSIISFGVVKLVIRDVDLWRDRGLVGEHSTKGLNAMRHWHFR